MLVLRDFLSCLRGSEPGADEVDGGHRFLSCLRGSEREPSSWQVPPIFLSCLRGSEREIQVDEICEGYFSAACAAVNASAIAEHRIPSLSQLPARQ